MKGARVMVVEDHALVAADLSALLGELECHVVGMAKNSSEALRLAELERPDLALMDIRLDGEPDGIEAAMQLRAAHAVPVVFVTAHSDPLTLDRARRAEPLGYITKPVTQSALHAALSMALYRVERERVREEERQWGERVLDAIQEAVVAMDPSGRIRFMNRVAERLTGVPWAVAQRQPIEAFLSAPVGKDWETAISSLQEQAAFAGEVRLVAAPRTEYWARMVPVRGGSGLTGIVMTLRCHPGAMPISAEWPMAVLCAGCKRIRDQNGAWISIERYLVHQLHVVWSHGICEECVGLLYPELSGEPRQRG